MVNFAEKYPLTEQEYLLQSPLCKRWQYTLSGWIRLIKCGPNDAELERQIKDRMWEDSEYSTKIHAEFEEWLEEGKKIEGDFNATMWEEEEDKIRKLNRKSIREGGKYKSRGKEKRREP